MVKKRAKNKVKRRKSSPFKMTFDPQTIKHLGLRMYSTLAPALAEIISNSYDADSSKVTVTLIEKNGDPTQVTVEDDGIGLSHDEISDKFLVIGRNRRDDEWDMPSKKYNRLPTGKKGLGKLALFGLAKSISVLTRQSGKQNEFILDWDDLMAAKGSYRPKAKQVDLKTKDPDGTIITMTGLKRKTPFDFMSLADSLSRIFLFDENFKLMLQSPSGDRIIINNQRKYDLVKKEFEWNLESTTLIPSESEYNGKVFGQLLASENPIPPSSGLRGITLFSRGKLVNAPEYFSSSTSSHFFQYITGWIKVDFIDILSDDVISTNRQSIDWEHPEMMKLREFLSGIISQVHIDWRIKRKEKKDNDLKKITGIDTQQWMNTLPADVKENTKSIIESLGGEDALEKFTPVIKALHDIIPEYPLLHWRHLHNNLRERIKSYYINEQYGDAASQGVQIYCEEIRNMADRSEDGCELVNRVFGSRPFTTPPQLQLNDLSTDSFKNIQDGQGHLSRGLVIGFRNPILHRPIDTNVPAVFTELDCLNILSLVSYLVTRMDNVTVNPIT